MPFQLISCHVAVAGDDTMVVPKDGITYPEYLVLRTIHGAENVRDLVATGEVARSSEEERARLGNLYGTPVVGQVFGQDFNELPEAGKQIRAKDDPMDAPAPAPAPARPVTQAAGTKR